MQLCSRLKICLTSPLGINKIAPYFREVLRRDFHDDGSFGGNIHDDESVESLPGSGRAMEDRGSKGEDNLMKTNNKTKILQSAGRMRRWLSGLPLVAKPTARVSRYRRAIALAAFFALLGASFILTAPNGLFSGSSLVSATTESIATVAADLTTPQNSWQLGQTAHARVDGAPVPGGIVPYVRRVIWVAPDGSVAQVHSINTASATDDYAIQSAGAFAQTGKWAVKTIDNRGAVHASAIFTVLSPTDNADASITETGPATIAAGNNVTYSLTVTNNGPDTAHDVLITSPVPANTTFVSETQDSGPTFSCATLADADGVITTSCSISTLAASQSAAFSLVYNVGSDVPNNTVIISTSRVSTSNETNSQDNTANAQTVVSATPPPAPCTVNCPSPITQNNDPSLCTAVVTFTTPGTTGSCADETGTTPPVVCSPPSGTAFPVGATQVTCSSGGNSCTFTVTVNDTRTPSTPTIGACPSNITVNENPPGTSSARVTYTAPSATGNCVTVSCNPPSGSLFVAGTTTVNCTATDSANNTASCSFTVTVNTTTCGIDCPDDKTVNESSAGSGSAVVTYSTPTTVGSCPSLTISCTPPSGSSFGVGVNTVNCTGNDTPSHIFTTCSFTITVNSIPTCTITCPANITQAANTTCSGNPCATVTYSAPTKSGTCSTDPVSCNPPSGSNFPVGTTTVHCTATDPNGNTGSCNFTVTITGGTTCTITCPANITDSSGGCGKIVTYPNPTTSGSCGDGTPPFSCNPPSGSFFPVGTTNVVCTTDVGTQCTFTVTISGSDTTAPTISSCASPRSAVADSNCQAEVPNMTSDVIATDNCTPADQLVVTQSPAPGSFIGIGTHTITLTVRDASNNSTQCTSSFTVSESIPPTALCKNATVFLDAAGNASVSATAVDNGSTDNCGIATRTVSPSTFTCANKGANTVTLTVTDGSGNSDSCQATVTVVDNLPPTITCPSNIIRSNDPNLCSAVVTYANATATDNCPGVGTPSCSPASGSVFPKGTTTVTCNVSDASSNSASCQFTVTVNDTQPPAITCPASITLEPTCPTGAIATYTAPVGTDNCPGPTTARTAGLASGSVFPIGTTTVTYTVTDGAGLTASCSFTVTVKTAAAVIQDLISRVQLLQSQGKLSGQNAQGLISKLQAALDALNDGKINVACNKLSDFISQVSAFINNGTLSSADGQPLINSAAKVRNTLGCTSLPCS